MSIDVTPDPDEIVQGEEEPYETRPVAVAVCGPVQTRELPGTHGGYKTEQNIGASVGVRLLSFEPRRKAAVITALDGDVWLSATQAGAQAGAAGAIQVPAVVPYVIDDMADVWCCAVSGSVSVSVKSTYWSN